MAAAGYVAWPYWALHSLEQAIKDRDVASLERAIDWVAVREGVRNDIAGISGSMLGQQDNALAGMFGVAMSAFAVEAFVTPQFFLQSLPRDEGSTLDRVNVTGASFRSPIMFVAEVRRKNETNPDAKVSVVFDFTGSGWKVTRVSLPVGKIAAIIGAGPVKATERTDPAQAEAAARRAREALGALDRLTTPSPSTGGQSAAPPVNSAPRDRDRVDLERLIQNAR